MDFLPAVPGADTTGRLNSIECGASISDTLGNLLFYTSGEAVWNRNHDTMPNGHDIAGNQSMEQGAVCVPKPGSNSLYYLFFDGYDDIERYYTFNYSIIDMNLDNGLGDVTATKNIRLFDQATEEIAATRHCNGRDYWIIGRKPIDNKLIFHAYLLTSTGIDGNVTTIINAPGLSGISTVGCMTFSQDGKLFVLSLTEIYIFDFNTGTGTFTLRTRIPRSSTGQGFYSNALSPDKTKLYTTSWVNSEWNYVFQYDLTNSDIPSTRITLDSVDFSHGSPTGYGFIGAMRLAPDQKIYLSRWNWDNGIFFSVDSLDVIDHPNASGTACNFHRNGVYLNHKPNEIGLPNFVSNFTTDVPATNTCGLVPIQLPDFNAAPGESSVKLNWKTAYELNNDHFSIEKSTDAKHFYTIGTIKANLNSSTLKTYFIYDEHPSSINYYRLKQFDIDGNVTVSKTLTVKFTGKESVALLQNPVWNHLQLVINTENNLPGIIRLYDPTGRLIKVFNANNGINDLDISFLSAGTYFLQFVSGGKEVSNLAFIKAKA